MNYLSDKLLISYILLTSGLMACANLQAEEIFSGPQPGELLSSFEVQRVFSKNGEAKVEVLKEDRNSPTLIVFVHKVTRPGVGISRLLLNYANTKKKEGMKSHLVFLTDDGPETEAWLNRARRALPNDVTPLISTDGKDGPGAYGLNRKVTLTVLVANEGKVTANFPLVQPSIQADAPKIGHAIVKALGGKEAPTLAQMGLRDRQMMRRGAVDPKQDATYRSMIAPVIQKTATPEEVEAAAAKVEEFAEMHPWFKQRVHKAANLIIGGGKLKNYGAPQAQAFLEKWAKEFADSETKSDVEAKVDEPEKARNDKAVAE